MERAASVGKSVATPCRCAAWPAGPKHPRQRLGEGGGGVLHPGVRLHVTAVPGSGPGARPTPRQQEAQQHEDGDERREGCRDEREPGETLVHGRKELPRRHRAGETREPAARGVSAESRRDPGGRLPRTRPPGSAWARSSRAPPLSLGGTRRARLTEEGDAECLGEAGGGKAADQRESAPRRRPRPAPARPAPQRDGAEGAA